ncbi:MAG: HNH endonuclease [Anaerolineales bacterium]|nr:HNH endonuclease [Anaerolineales bacterium]
MSEKENNYFELDITQLALHVHRGYLMFYMPKHPLAVQNGMVALHRHVASVYQETWLQDGDIVTFINGDRSDYRIENLEVTNRAEMGHKLFLETPRIELTCPQCGKVFLVEESQVSRRKNCSDICRRLASRKLDITAEELENLVWEMSTVKVAELLGVSDKAIEKRCKKLGVRKPPRGYWAKMEHGYISPEEEARLRGQRLDQLNK